MSGSGRAPFISGHPTTPIVITLQVQQWRTVLAMLAEAPYRIANPLIEAIAGGIANTREPFEVVKGGLAAKSKRGRRGRPTGRFSEGLKATLSALFVYLLDNGEPPTSARKLARDAADLASTLGLAGSDMLQPDDAGMRELAGLALAAYRRRQRGAAED